MREKEKKMYSLPTVVVLAVAHKAVDERKAESHLVEEALVDYLTRHGIEIRVRVANGNAR